ncbi:hypothetical protein, partial [Thiolapillus sp.]|uniref:hypothetical protein n=1 Tax=Thiolapillus sp. TaxID=2017437 RepID=UPI003AF41FA3
MSQNLSRGRRHACQVLAEHHAVDAVFSWSVFEHVPQSQIPVIFADLYNSLHKGGLFFLQIEPLYYSPWGSHLRRFIDVPWAHLLWPGEQLRTAVMQYSGDIPPQHQGKRPRIDTFFQNTISHRLSPVPPQRRRMPWPRPTVLTASP